MRIQSRHARRSVASAGINLTPMLDMIFNLIFFFILATTIRVDSAEIEVTLPRASNARPGNQPGELSVVTIDRDGNLYFDGRQVIEEELRLELNALAREGAKGILLRTDGDVLVKRDTEVMNFCLQAGITNIHKEVSPRADSAPGAANR